MAELTKEQLQQLIRDQITPMWDEERSRKMAEIDEARRKSALPIEMMEVDERLERANQRAFGGFLRTFAAARGNLSRAQEDAKKVYGEESLVYSALTKTLTTNVAEAGGVLIPEELSASVIELLRVRSVVRAAGPISLPMPTGSLTVPRLTGGATSGYVAEATPQNASQPTFGDLTLTWKKLRTSVPVSNELLRFARPNVDAILRDDAVASMATRQDLAFIRGDGTVNTPKGMRYWSLAANVLPSVAANDGSAPTLAEVETDISTMLNTMEQADVRMIRPAWFMAPRSKNYLMILRDANGNLAFPEMRANPARLWGLPVFVTTNIPINLGAGTDPESEIYLADMADAVIGEATSMEVAVSTEASYTNSGGTLVSAFDRDETILKFLERHDFAFRHAESIVVLTNVVYWPS